MAQSVPAVYEHGVLTPLEPLDLAERQRVIITIHGPAPGNAEEILAEWRQVSKGLSEAELRDIEAIALDRSRFMRQGP